MHLAGVFPVSVQLWWILKVFVTRLIGVWREVNFAFRLVARLDEVVVKSQEVTLFATWSCVDLNVGKMRPVSTDKTLFRKRDVK